MDMQSSSSERSRISVAFSGLVMIGIISGSWGVILPSLSAYYGISKSIVGLIFFASAFGYFLSATSSGPLMAKLGERWFLVAGTSAFLIGNLVFAFRPPFTIILMLRLFQGLGIGMLETGLNRYIASLPRNTALLNYLHAFYGIGALIGPIITSALLALSWSWNTPYFIWAALILLLVISIAIFFKQPELVNNQGSEQTIEFASQKELWSMGIIWLGTLFLLVYCGVEASLGNWIYTFLLEQRHQGALLAGWIVSGYWLGLTMGRFLLNNLAERLNIGKRNLIYLCIGGTLLMLYLIWQVPLGLVAAVGFCCVGVFLGPIYPTTIAWLPDILPKRMVAGAMGLMVGFSIIGIAVFPWLAGTLAQNLGSWSLVPYVLLQSLIMGGIWWLMRGRKQSAAL